MHSRHVKRDAGRGIELATAMIERPGAGEQHQRELLYLRAVREMRSDASVVLVFVSFGSHFSSHRSASFNWASTSRPANSWTRF